MRTFILVVFISLFVIGYGFALTGPDIPTGEKWRPWAENELTKIEGLEYAEQFVAIRRWLNLGHYGQIEDQDELAVFKRAQSIMMSKPGYAHWVRSEIDRRWELTLQERDFKRRYRGKPVPVDAEFYQAEYRYEIEGRDLIASLGFLPGHETVEVLGELLSDERHGHQRGGRLSPRSNEDGSNALKAAMALKRLRVGPIDGAEDLGLASIATYPQVDILLNWWEEVKAGEREYEFGWEGWKYYKGKYMIRSKEELLRLNDSSKVMRKTPALPASSQKPTEKKQRWPVFMALGLLVLAVTLALLNRRAQSS